ncbi:MAG: hypothetical protein II819_07660 [Fibrobacter sp.]|jgi:hypothetical protein|nr:hypothetical protein [Fibrobacter sp.]
MVQEGIEKYRFIRLNENNVVESFDCGDQDLNDFQFMNAEDTDPHTRMMYFDLKDIVD